MQGLAAMSGRILAPLSLVLLVALALGLSFLTRPMPPKRPDVAHFEPVAFADLQGWREDNMLPALQAFRLTCARWQRLPDERALGGAGIAGRLADWRPACKAAATTAEAPAAVRAFFEARFRPYAVSVAGSDQGLFTGYYEPLLQGSRQADARYRVPLYTRPDDLVSVDLGRFRDEWKGMRTAGRVENGELVPYHRRAGIDAGALDGRRLEIVYVDDPVDAFFLHIQGSGRVLLDSGEELRLGYAAQNGHGYFAIGRELIRRGALTRETVSMQSIRAWLASHPDQAAEVMELNGSYVFFRELQGAGPIGAGGVALTPERSLAVDRRFIPLGAPVWLDAAAPVAEGGDRTLRRLLVAQDTGGAIRGAVRGDVFWGHGERAAEIAGRMQHNGRLYLLLPVGLPVGGAG